MSLEISRVHVTVGAETGELKSGLQGAQREVTAFSEHVKAGIGLAAGFAAFSAAFESVKVVAGSLKGSVIDFNQTLDSTRTSLSRFVNEADGSLAAFMADLKSFAALTPFEFKDLATLAPRLAAARVPIDQIIPAITAMGNAAAASGKLSEESMGRITTAITQMLGKGRVQAEEMNQLIEGGMADAWSVLARELGVSEAAARKMVEAGQVAGTTMFNAMLKAYEGAVLLDKASRTISGAMSTIRDVTTQTLANAFRPLYEDITRATVAVADFLQTKEFQAWAEAFRSGVGAALASIKEFLSGLAPVGEAIKTAFMQATSGDFSGALRTLTGGIATAFSETVQAAQQFGAEMFGAGYRLIEEYARGIVEGGGSLIEGAVDAVASTIAAFLVGHSPPPQGPLSEIDAAGKRLMETYGEGMQQGLEPSKEAVKQLDAELRKIADATRDLDFQSSDLKRTIEDIKRGYEDQLRPLEEQLRLIEEKRSEGEREAQLQFKLQEIELRRLEIAARGDPVRRAEIQRQIELVKQQQQALGLEESIASVQRERARLSEDGKRARLEEMQFRRQEEELERRIKEARREGKDTGSLRQQLEELRLRREIAESERADREEANRRKLENLRLREQEIGLQRDLDALTDKGKLAEIARQRELLATAKEEYEIQRATADIEADAAKRNLLEQVRAIKDEQRAQIEPLQQQLESISRQKEELSRQRAVYQGIRQDIQDVLAAQKEAERAAKDAAKALTGGPELPRGPQSYQRRTDASLEQFAQNQGKILADKVASGFREFVASHWPQMVGGAIGLVVGGMSFGPLGAAIGATVGVALVGKLQEVLMGRLGDAIRQFVGRIGAAFRESGDSGVFDVLFQSFTAGFETLAEKAAGLADRAISAWEKIMPSLLGLMGESVDRLLALVGEATPKLAAKLYDWALAFLGWLRDSAPQMLDRLATLAAALLDWIGQQTTKIAGRLLDWATAFIQWIGPRIPELLTELGRALARLVEWIGANAGRLADGFGRWAQEFIAWVGPKIPPLLAELGKLLVALTVWLADTALPAITAKLLEWGEALVRWVAPRIGPLLLELGKLLLAVGAWIVTEAIPAVAKGALEIGAALVEGIWKGVQAWWETGKRLFSDFVGWIISLVKEIFGVQSPSTVFQEIGTALLEGLWVGVTTFWERTLKGWWEGFKTIVLDALGWGQGALSWAGELIRVGQGILGGVKGGIDAFWAETLRPWFEGFKGAIFGALGLSAESPGSVSWMYETGRGLLGQFWDGLKSVWGDEDRGDTVAGWFRQIIDWIPDFIKRRLDHRSPSHVMYALGENTMRGFLDGLKAIFPDARTTMRELVGIFTDIDVDASEWAQLARDAARRADFPFPDVFVRQMRHESANWDPDVIWGLRHSSAGAVGIAQIMPQYHPGVNPYDPFESLDYAARLMTRHLREYDDLIEALVAYNGGGGAVRWWRRGDPYDESVRYIEAILGNWRNGIPGIPDLAEGGIVLARAGGTLLRAGEAGRDEAILPLPAGWRAQQDAARETIHVPIIIGGQVIEELWIEGRELAIRRGRA